ncbi:MAG: hypothetical protein HY646_16575 [Acidobacteria bacterium]|nr:hypothetical protein [Acidobacteriota bacterium]
MHRLLSVNLALAAVMMALVRGLLGQSSPVTNDAWFAGRVESESDDRG